VNRRVSRLHAGCEHSLGVAKGCGARCLLALSICLPIIAPPQVRGREIFLDGSLLDNLPVKAMAEMGEGPSIAVDVKAAFERSNDGTAVPGVRDNRPARLPRLGETLTRVLLLGNENTEAARRHADLLIKPRAEGAGLLEFHKSTRHVRPAERLRRSSGRRPDGSPEIGRDATPAFSRRASRLGRRPGAGRAGNDFDFGL
jgi:predicted acylesterase/phospholipase RssA